MANPFTSGAVSCFISISNTVQFLGHTEAGPDINHRFEREPVMSDLSGSRIPFDVMFQGETAIVGLTLTRWNSAIMDAVEKGLNTASALLGSDGDLARGTLMQLEGATYPLVLISEHRTKATMTAAGMETGRRYLFAVPDQLTDIRGRRANKKRISFFCHSGYNAATRRFQLYDFDVASAFGVSTV